MTDSPDIGRTRPRPSQDVFAGAIFLLIAAAFGWEATNYEMGQAVRMGPGFIPLALAILLAVLGASVALAGAGKHDHAQAAPVPWRGIVLVCVALVIFGAYARALGIVPIVFLCALITSLASTRNTVVAALGIAVALAALCWAVFKLGLGLPLPTIGPVFGRLQVY